MVSCYNGNQLLTLICLMNGDNKKDAMFFGVLPVVVYT